MLGLLDEMLEEPQMGEESVAEEAELCRGVYGLMLATLLELPLV